MRSHLIEPEDDPESIPIILTSPNGQLIQLLTEMGFTQEFIEISISYTNSNNINDLLAFMIKGENGWDHEFIRNINLANDNDICEICKDTPNSHANFILENEINTSDRVQEFQQTQARLSHIFSFMDSDPGEDLCEICLFDLVSPYSLPKCSVHKFCLTCINKYLEILISDSKVMNIKCPGNKCEHEFPEDEIIRLVSEEVFSKYLKFKQRAELLKDPTIKWCMRPDCEGYVKGTEYETIKECPICAFQICFKCGKAWHPKKTCDQVIEADYEAWAVGKEIQLCPSCKHRIEKIEGCNHMTCAICQYNFCWLCRGKYSSNHFNKLNPFGCPNLQSGFNTRDEWPMWKIYCARLKGFCIWFIILIFSPLLVVFGPAIYVTANFYNRHYYIGICKLVIYCFLLFVVVTAATPLAYAVGIPFFMLYGSLKLLRRCYYNLVY